MSAPQPHFVSIHRAISWAMSLLKVQLNICTKATLRADESGCCGEVGGGNITFFWGVHVYCAQLVLTIIMPRIVLLTLTRRQMTFNRQKHVGAKCQSAKGTSLYRAPGKKSSTENAGARLWLLLHWEVIQVSCVWVGIQKVSLCLLEGSDGFEVNRE